MSLRRKLNWCNLQGFVNSSVLCVITFVQATMTQWHCNCWVGDGMENEPIWGDFTLCIVYWYHVQFLNTLYLQYLCIFYEVIKITLLTISDFSSFCYRVLGVDRKLRYVQWPSTENDKGVTAHALSEVAAVDTENCCCWCGWNNGVSSPLALDWKWQANTSYFLSLHLSGVFYLKLSKTVLYVFGLSLLEEVTAKFVLG